MKRTFKLSMKVKDNTEHVFKKSFEPGILMTQEFTFDDFGMSDIKIAMGIDGLMDDFLENNIEIIPEEIT